MRLLLLTLALTAGCGANALEGLEDQPRPSRFVGQWLVHETQAHALFSASLFRFDADGTLSQTWDAGHYGGTHGYVQRGTERCPFGSRWETTDGSDLRINARCSDERDRVIALRFLENGSSNAIGATVEIENVGGESGWEEPQWGWGFRKCATLDATFEECTPR